LISSDSSDYPLWYPQTLLIIPFGILRLFWLPPLVSSDFSDYPLWYPQTFLQPDEQCQHYQNGSSYLCRVSLRVLIMKMVVSKSKCVENNCLITPFGILRLFWLPPLVSSDFSDILLSSEVDTVEWLCTFQFWDLSAQLFSTHFDVWGYQRGNQKSLRISKGVIRRVWGYQRG
jgi:hypothetical protein